MRAIWPAMLPTEPGRARHDDGLAGLRPAHVEQPEVRGQTAQPEHPEVHRGRRERRVDARHARAVRDRVALHSEHPVDLIADVEVRMTGVDDAPDAGRAHDLADLHRRHVGAAGVHPCAHRRVEREVLDLDPELAVPGLRRRLLDVAPVRGLGQAGRAGGQAALGVDERHRLTGLRCRWAARAGSGREPRAAPGRAPAQSPPSSTPASPSIWSPRCGAVFS